jgi:glycosyltransferase involved in cell wall biosynthesis
VCRYVGEVGGREKFELLAGARGLLNTIRWPEPFGLVMIEALARGTPVLAFPRGAAPEIIRHGETGFLCTDEADIVRRVREAGLLDRGACRRSVDESFSAERMVADHLELNERQFVRRRSARDLPMTDEEAGLQQEPAIPSAFPVSTWVQGH